MHRHVSEKSIHATHVVSSCQVDKAKSTSSETCIGTSSETCIRHATHVVSSCQVEKAKSTAKLLKEVEPQDPPELQFLQGFMIMFALLANMKKLSAMGPKNDGRPKQIAEIEGLLAMARECKANQDQDVADGEGQRLIPAWAILAAEDLIAGRNTTSSVSSSGSGTEKVDKGNGKDKGNDKGKPDQPAAKKRKVAAKSKAQGKAKQKKGQAAAKKRRGDDGEVVASTGETEEACLEESDDGDAE